jgi:hypothetical protein
MKILIDPNDSNYAILNLVKVNLNDLRAAIVALQKDGFSEMGLADLLLYIKSMQEKISA